MTEPSTIAFFTCPGDGGPGSGPVLGIRVDGVDLRRITADATAALWAAENGEADEEFLLFQHGGLPAGDVLPPSRHLLGEAAGEYRYFGADDARVPLLGCSCGLWGCWPLLARVREDAAAGTVVWDGFLQPFRRERWGPLPIAPRVFDADRYRAALAAPERLAADPLAAGGAPDAAGE